MGAWHRYSGKPHGTLVVPGDGRWHRVDVNLPAPPTSGLEWHMLYANVRVRWRATRRTGGIVARWCRHDDPDGATAYQTWAVVRGANDHLFLTHTHWEAGRAGHGGHWELKTTGGISRLDIGTRYAKSGGVP